VDAVQGGMFRRRGDVQRRTLTRIPGIPTKKCAAYERPLSWVS